MPEKDPLNFSLLTYAWVLLLSGWGGIVSFIRKVKSGDANPHNVMEFVGEIVTSAFAGLLTFWCAEAAGFAPLWTAVLVGISGHMGTRAIYQLEMIVKARTEQAVK